MDDVDCVVVIGEVNDEAYLGILGAKVLEGSVGVDSNVGSRFVERYVLQYGMAVMFDIVQCCMGAEKCLELRTRVFALPLERCAVMEGIHR